MGHAQGQTMPYFPLDDLGPSNTIDLGQDYAQFFLRVLLWLKSCFFLSKDPSWAMLRAKPCQMFLPTIWALQTLLIWGKTMPIFF